MEPAVTCCRRDAKAEKSRDSEGDTENEME